VDAYGNYSLITNSTELYNYEGFDVVPIDPDRYGPLSGSIIVSKNQLGYSGSGLITNLTVIANGSKFFVG
jgi:hypothetical protein